MPVPLRTNANLKVEAKFNVVTEFPNFDLHSAAAAGNIGLVEYALSRGQPVNSVLDGVLPLHAACAGGDEQVVKLLIEHGADVNAPRLPRKYSTSGGRDASAPIVGTSGSTPLHFAAANGNKNIILTLLLRGAHPDRADKHGVTPEMLARKNKWIECADLLHNWVEKRDRDLRERQNPLDEQQLSPGMEADSVGSRKRLQVKRSIDTALNILKASSSGLSDTYLRPPASSSSSNNFPSQTPPASPNRSEYPPMGTPSDDGRFTPSPIDLASRRPSLPQLFSPPPPVAGSRSHKPATLTKPSPSPRRPRSAGTGAERDDCSVPSFGRGGAGRLGSKYSFMNLFKKGSENEGMTSHQTSSSLSISTSHSQSNSSNFEIETTSHRTPGRFRVGSETPHRTRTSSTSQTPGLHAKTPSISQDYSPSHPPMPLAIDLHNALAQQQMTRDRSGSSSSRFDVDDSVSFGSPSSVSSSPLTKFGLLRGKGPSMHSRDRSGSGASLNPNRNVAVFDEEAGDTSVRSKTRPGILRGHHRSTSFGQGQQNSRAFRFDGSQSRSNNDRVPESAPATVPEFGPHEDIKEEEDEYGRPLDRAELPMLGPDAHTTIPSDFHFPFSINKPPLSVEDASSPVTVKLQVPSPIDHRDRGGSISSNSTTDSLFTRPHRNIAEVANADSETVTTPVLSGADSSSFQSSPKPASERSHSEGPQVESMSENFNMTSSPRRALGIDMSLIESHAEAEALVQRAQQDILDLAHPDSISQPTSGDGWTPLSAMLAAYGESLALEKKLRQQKERSAGDPPSLPNTTDSMSWSPQRQNGVNRQYSLEHRSPSSGNRIKAPRRPHTSSGTESTPDGPVGYASTVGVSSSLDASRSAPVEPQQRPPPEYEPVMRARTPDPDERSSRVSSLDEIDTDSELGAPLTRVSTAPIVSPLKSKREQSRSAAKLTRMGFPNDVNGRVPPPTNTSKRFGLKSIMQSLKSKP